MRANPFSRARAMFAALAAAMALPIGFERQQAINAVGLYKSRGKGLGRYSGKGYGNHSYHTPHQGKRECARRRRQIALGILPMSVVRFSGAAHA